MTIETSMRDRVAEVLGEHTSTGNIDYDAHPWKVQCECGAWSILLVTHQADALAASGLLAVDPDERFARQVIMGYEAFT